MTCCPTRAATRCVCARAVLACLFTGTSVASALAVDFASEDVISAEVVVYGDASGGVIAAVQAARLGKQTVLVSQYGQLGGMTSS